MKKLVFSLALTFSSLVGFASSSMQLSEISNPMNEDYKYCIGLGSGVYCSDSLDEVIDVWNRYHGIN